MNKIKKFLISNLWQNNSALIQLLGLCPVLAVTSTAINALGLGIATTLVLTSTNIAISLSRRWVPYDIRIPTYIIIIGSVVSCIQMLINAYAYALYQSLGIFIPLIITNCIILGRAETLASKSIVSISAFDGITIGLGATSVMLILGLIREIISTGTIFNGAEHLVGSWGRIMRIEIIHLESPMLLAILPPGAFILLGILLAIKSTLDNKQSLNIKKRKMYLHE